jgi:hypothetical protein
MQNTSRTSKQNDRFTRVADFGRELRGLGGGSIVHIRAFPGASLGAASEGRKLSPAEREAIEAQMRRDGKL